MKGYFPTRMLSMASALKSNMPTPKNVAKLAGITQIVPGIAAQGKQQGNAALTFWSEERLVLPNIAYGSRSQFAGRRPYCATQGSDTSFDAIADVRVQKATQAALFGRNSSGSAALITSQPAAPF